MALIQTSTDEFIALLPSTIEEHDYTLSLDRSATFIDTTNAQSHSIGAALDDLSQWISETNVGGEFLICTSTAGSRSSTHEISADLLAAVLGVVESKVSRNNILVTDGPAYAPTFQQDCERLGYAAIARARDVTIYDLNTDPDTIEIFGIPCSKRYLSANGIISLCRAKTHRRFGVSLSRKAALCAIVGSRTGYPKLQGKHSLVPALIENLFKLNPNRWMFVDANPSIQGEGPLSGFSCATEFVVYGRTSLSIDVLTCLQFGFDPALVLGLMCNRSPRESNIAEPIDWEERRFSQVNLLPASTHSWLYGSIPTSRDRVAIFDRIKSQLISCLSKNRLNE